MNIHPKKSAQHIYDYVVIGSGLNGLLITSALSRVTSNVLLLEAAETHGGANQNQISLVGAANNGFRFFPDSELSRKSLDFLSQLLPQPVGAESVENLALTYEAGGLRPFVGFGDTPPSFYEEFSYFLSPRRLNLSSQPYEWTQWLFENSNADFMPKSYVTKFIEEDGQITRALVNGQKTVLGRNFIYCGPTQSLSVLLPEAALSPRARQKLSKAKFWTAICLDLVHSQATGEPGRLHVLNGTTQDDQGPCVGQFFVPAEASGLQLSQWVSFIDNEAAEDAEQVGLTLKKIKRQIKRAFPTALENLQSERIFVAASIGGDGELKLNANQSISTLPNFWVASGTLSPQKNLLGCLQQAELVCSALGFHPAVAASNEVALTTPESSMSL